MKLINRISLFLSILPILLVITVSALNFKEKTSLRFLIWQTPELNLGTYMTIGTSMGYIYSLLLFSSFNMNESEFKIKRIVKKQYKSDTEQEINEGKRDYDLYNEETINDSYIERDVRDPNPTVSVPFKVISKNKNKKYTRFEKEDRENSYNEDQSLSSTFNNKTDDLGWNKLELEDW
tara:strand:- start:418 stop:951 length:534 start_codon:yes stop_codon:yes gene_type:complete